MRQLMHSFHGLTAPQAILDGVEQGIITSFCLFSGMNVESPGQLRELTDSLREAARRGGFPPPLIGIDQEGGQLMAVYDGATELPGNMALGATRSPELAEQVGRVLARELLAMGINFNFAPSVDVNINSSNPVVGIRSFGSDPQLVAELGAAMIRGMQAEGIIACAKHFPGHGDTAQDTHFAAPIIDHPLERLEAVELPPFQAAIDAGVGAVMSAHIITNALDPENPATISRAVMTDLLRGQLGFDGLVITDAMDMHAVAKFGHLESFKAALEAGADVVLMAHVPDQLSYIDKLMPYENPKSVARIEALRRAACVDLPPLDILDCDEHHAIAWSVAERSITLVKQGGQFPLKPADKDLIVVITPQLRNLTPADTSAQATMCLGEFVQRRHSLTNILEIPATATEADIPILLDIAGVDRAAQVIVGTIAADQDPVQAGIVQAIMERGHSPIVAALRTPYDLIAFPMVETYLCTYGIRPVTIEALVKVLFGEIQAQGVLPCAMPEAVN